MADILNRAVLNLRKPGAEQLTAVEEPALSLRAQDRKHRLGDGFGLLRSELPCAEGWQIPAEENVGVLHRLGHAARDVLLDDRPAGIRVETAHHAQELHHRLLAITCAVIRQSGLHLLEESPGARGTREWRLEKGQRVHDVRAVDGELESDNCACRVTCYMGTTDAQMTEERRRVGRMLGEANRPRARRAADLSPLVVPDQVVAPDQRLLKEEWQEAVRDGTGADEDHRLA